MSNYWKPEYNNKREKLRRLKREKAHMEKLNKFKIITDKITLGYTAGIIDGEGCIIICKNKTLRKGHKNISYLLQVRVGMATTQAVTLLHKTFGGSYAHRAYGKHTPMNIWTINSIAAEGFLKLILPYLKVKQEEAKVALEFREHMNNYMGRNGRRLNITEIALREAYKLKMQELKKCVI